MSTAAELFAGNVQELQKIIKENYFMAAGQEEALEFLEAIESNFKTAMAEKASDEIDQPIFEEDEPANILVLEDFGTVEPGDLTLTDYGAGWFLYYHKDLNLKFLLSLQEWLENYKTKK